MLKHADFQSDVMQRLKWKVQGFLENVKITQEERKTISKVIDSRLTYLSRGKLAKLCRYVKMVSCNSNHGQIIETGCAMGGSSILMASCKPRSMHLRIYDTFSMIPPPSADDDTDVQGRYKIICQGAAKGLGGDVYYGYTENLYEKVHHNFMQMGLNIDDLNVEMIKGLIQDTLKVTTPVLLAHIDVDWFEAVKVSIDRIWPQLCIDGVMVFDDYYTYSGCRKAVDQFLDSVDNVLLDGTCGSLAVIKHK